MKKYAIGVDIGGSHITSAVIDIKNKKLLPNSLFTGAVNNKAEASQILNSWVLVINKSLRTISRNELAGIGFAMPGPFEYNTGIARFSSAVDKYENLSGVNIAQYLTNIFSFKDESYVRFINDASAFAIGEAWFGKAAGTERSVSVTLGTGFGSAFIENGLPVVERNDVPQMGCVWHLDFKNGIADDYFSTRWFIKRYAEKTGKVVAGVKEIADTALTDPKAKEPFIEYGQNLGTFLGPWLMQFNAQSLVIGGNISAAYNLLGGVFEQILSDLGMHIPIHISVLKEEAALIGSARMFESVFWDSLKPLLIKM